MLFRSHYDSFETWSKEPLATPIWERDESLQSTEFLQDLGKIGMLKEYLIEGCIVRTKDECLLIKIDNRFVSKDEGYLDYENCYDDDLLFTAKPYYASDIEYDIMEIYHKNIWSTEEIFDVKFEDLVWIRPSNKITSRKQRRNIKYERT